MYIEFEGVAGSCGCGFGAGFWERGERLFAPFGVEGLPGELGDSATGRKGGSFLEVGHGGGNGETETEVMEAVCAL